MLIENLKETASNIVERLKNPFGGTLIVAWAVVNWKLLFTVFNFDDNQNLNQKIQIIQDYISAATQYNLIWLPLWYTFIGLTSYLFFQNISLVIFTFFQKWVKPLVYWLIDRNKIIDKKSYEDLRKTTINSQKDFEQVRVELLAKNNENSDLLKQISEKEISLSKITREFNEYKDKRLVFRDTFNEDRNWYSRHYWGDAFSDEVCVIKDGMMTFTIESPHQLRNTEREKGTGAYVNIVGGIFNGETYIINVRVSADVDSTLKFKLWVHDTVGNTSTSTLPKLIGTNKETITITAIANETNALRIHLHIEEGIGKLYVHELKVARQV